MSLGPAANSFGKPGAARLDPPGMPVAEPHKELRFTRAAQAVPFWIGAAVCAAAALVLLSLAAQRDANPALPHPLWALVPLAAGYLFIRAALHCTRRAYLILTPLGIEIFPFFRPVQGMQLIPWQQIDAFEIGPHLLTLHFAADQSGGVHLTLAPIPRDKRPMLAKALEGRLPLADPDGPDAA